MHRTCPRVTWQPGFAISRLVCSHFSSESPVSPSPHTPVLVDYLSLSMQHDSTVVVTRKDAYHVYPIFCLVSSDGDVST